MQIMDRDRLSHCSNAKSVSERPFAAALDRGEALFCLCIEPLQDISVSVSTSSASRRTKGSFQPLQSQIAAENRAAHRNNESCEKGPGGTSTVLARVFNFQVPIAHTAESSRYVHSRTPRISFNESPLAQTQQNMPRLRPRRTCCQTPARILAIRTLPYTYYISAGT